MLLRSVFAVVLSLVAASPAWAQPVKVALVVTLTGPLAPQGMQLRDGFRLGLKRGGSQAEVTVIDDQQDAAVAASALKKLLEKEPPDVVVGPIAPALFAAAIKPASDAGSVLIGAGLGPQAQAGRQCSANTFFTLWQDDQPIEVIARHADEAGLKRLAIIASDDAAGNNAIAVIRRHARGEIVAEIKASADKSDFSADVANLVAAGPQAVIMALRGLGEAAFLRQFSSVEGTGAISLMAMNAPDLATFASADVAPREVLTGSNWATGLDVPESRDFIAAFEAEFGYTPGPVAVAGYDAAQLVESAVRKLKGNIADRAGLRAAIRGADIKSPRGAFSFANNNFPIQDFYLVRNFLEPQGKPQTKIVKQVFSRYGDAYASECTLR